MPRPHKRKAGQPDYDNPITFADDYCRRYNIPYDQPSSAAEKECVRHASDAREDYKTRRDAAANNSGSSSPRSPSNAHAEPHVDRKGLSPAQKYTIRLQNNRKSANAAKVYAEILKRLQAAFLHRLTPTQVSATTDNPNLTHHSNIPSTSAVNPADCVRCRESLTTIAQRRDEITRLNNLLTQAQNSVKEEQRQREYERRRADNLNDELQAMSRRLQEAEATLNSRDTQLALRGSPIHVPASSPMTKVEDVASTCALPTAAQLPVVTTVVVESQSQHDNLPPPQSAQGTPNRLISSRGAVHHQQPQPHHTFSMSMSQSDVKDFPGLGYSQSQPDDGDDKCQLMRNMPSSGGIPLMLDSQPSQSDLPTFKGSIGSEDLGTDYFVSSQGTVDGGTPKKARLS